MLETLCSCWDHCNYNQTTWVIENICALCVQPYLEELSPCGLHYRSSHTWTSTNHCFAIATMTRRKREAMKRKQQASGTSPCLPAPKRQQGEPDEELTTAQFTKCLLDSLNNPDVRDTYLSIVDEGIAKHISKLEARAAEDEKRITNLEAELEKMTVEKTATEMELQDLLQYYTTQRGPHHQSSLDRATRKPTRSRGHRRPCPGPCSVPTCASRTLGDRAFASSWQKTTWWCTQTCVGEIYIL